MQVSVVLSKLVATKCNPRKVKPAKDAHRRLVASIKAHGLLQPLVVREAEGGKQYLVIAGNRRLAALREVHKGKDAKIPCMLDKREEEPAEAISLAENFAREGMHPLDEAETFAALASGEGKDAEAIAADFGVTKHYVQQRMKLAALAEVIKSNYRQGHIDTAVAEAFSAVPEAKQIELWKELDGNPHHARQVRNRIATAWIDGSRAIFDIATLPAEAVSRDLFDDKVLIERRVFMDAQVRALIEERDKLVETGWSDAVIGQRENVRDRLLSMDAIEPEFDAATTKKLKKLEEQQREVEKQLNEANYDDHAAVAALEAKCEAAEAEVQAIVAKADKHFSEQTKARGTVFLILDGDGQVHREYRVPRRQQKALGKDESNGGDTEGDEAQAPTSDELSDKQLATAFTHEALAVRDALSKHRGARRRLLVLILHEIIHSDALDIKHDGNAVTLHAFHEEGFKSPAFDALQQKRHEVDPFKDQHHVEDVQAYERLRQVPDAEVDALIEILTVECLTTQLRRPTPLIRHMAKQLNVNVRQFWRPDEAWLASYQKIQLAHLITELMGNINAPSPDRKKSELVTMLAKLFADAAEGRIVDKKLAERINAWLPVNLRKESEKTKC